MPLEQLDHVNILTDNVAGMTVWYEDVLGFKAGWRPDFSDNGAWLYLGDHPLVHLVEAKTKPAESGRIEHFSFFASNLAGFRKTLADKGIEAREAKVPGMDILQVNVFDPDGNHIHVDFDLGAEASAD